MRRNRLFRFVLEIIVLTIFLLLLTIFAKVASADIIVYGGEADVEVQQGPWCVGVSLEYAYERMYKRESPLSGEAIWYNITEGENRGTTFYENVRVMRKYLDAYWVKNVTADKVVRYMMWDTQLLIGFHGYSSPHMAPVIGYDTDTHEFIYLDTRGDKLGTGRVGLCSEDLTAVVVVTRLDSGWAYDIMCHEVHWTKLGG